MKTESRLPKIDTTNGDPPIADRKFILEFTKADADALMSCLDVTLKAAGLPAAQSVNMWASKVRDAMSLADKP